eukprot:8629377-Alexandrium_andersonii.AAC.1
MRPAFQGAVDNQAAYTGVRNKKQQFTTNGVYCSSNSETCTMAPGIRTLNCAGPGMASMLLPEAPE